MMVIPLNDPPPMPPPLTREQAARARLLLKPMDWDEIRSREAARWRREFEYRPWNGKIIGVHILWWMGAAVACALSWYAGSLM